MAPRGRRLTGNEIKNFRNVHEGYVQAQKPGWAPVEVQSCLTFMWNEIVPQDEKFKYSARTYRPDFPWILPVNAPPDDTIRRRGGFKDRARAFREDAANWPRPPPNPNTTIPTTQLQAPHNELNAVRKERDDIRNQKDSMTAEEDALRAESEAIEAQRDTLAADAAATPSDPGSLRDSGRLESMNAELAALRRKVAAPGHWPNLAHLPVADPIPPGTDPTGSREEVEVFGQECRAAIRYHEGEQNSADQWRTSSELNKYARGRDVALKYERMIYGSIEGVDDGKPGKHEGGLWRFQKFLGEGGYGTVGLWRKRDETTGDILDSVAVKDEGALSTPDWINPLNWRDGLPIEIWMHEHFKKIKPACPYLAPSRGYRLNLEQRRTRLYLVFMPGHNLSDLMKMKPRNPEWEDDYEIPHEFMFYTFLAMAEACLALDRGWWGEHRPVHEESSKNDGRREGWVPIVHRDIKPENVFLGLADWDEMKKWDMFPTPVIADFGMSFEAYADDPYNPENFAGYGTLTYMAPEQNLHRPLKSRYTKKLSDRTNVFAIATSIFEMWQGRCPGFWADTKKWDDDAQESKNDERHGHFRVLPQRDYEHVEAELYAAHADFNDALRECGQKEQNFDEWLAQEELLTLGAKKAHWVDLWELESWDANWLLRNRVTKERKVFKLESRWELKLAHILRRCLEWDPNDRPSIQTLRDMLHDAITDLDIKPNDADENQPEEWDSSSDIQDNGGLVVENRAGLICVMDRGDAVDSVENLSGVDQDMIFRYKQQKLNAWRDLRRREFLTHFRPADISSYNRSPTTTMTSSSDDSGDSGGPLIPRRAKRKREDGDV